MNPAEVNGIVPTDNQRISSSHNMPVTSGQIQTADFMASGNLLLLYRHLKDMYEPPIHSDSGPIKPLTSGEIQREQHKPQEDFVNSLEPTIVPLSPLGK